MHILVTGGAGFIGSHVVEKLLEKRYNPVVVDNLSTGKRTNLPAKVKFYKLDIQSPRLRSVFKNEKIGAVCHLAAKTNVRESVKNPLVDAATNVSGMINLLENCRKFNVKKFIFSSTGGALYGDAKELPTPETYDKKPISPYGINKLTGERYLYYYNKLYGLPAVILRYSNVYGPRQDRKGEGGVIAIFIKRLIKGERPIIYGNGRQTRDFVYVKDVARANILGLRQKNKGFSTYNISTGKDISINNLYKILTKKLGKNLKPAYGTKIEGEIMKSCLDSTRAAKTLGWGCEYDIHRGLDETIGYFNCRDL